MTPDVFITNYNANFTGVSATIQNLVPEHQKSYHAALVGHALSGVTPPLSIKAARRLAATPPPDRPFSIWHVRREKEMFPALLLRDLFRFPIKVVFTSPSIRRKSYVPRKMMARCDALIATSEYAAPFFDPVSAIAPHGVNPELLRPLENKPAAWAALGYGGARGIATIGRIRPEKGTDLFVQSMIKALPELPDTTALVIGKATKSHTAFAQRLKDDVAAAGLSHRILFPGELAMSVVQKILPALSLVVQPARYEGHGMVPLEAMACGTAFVGTPTGYFREFADDGARGLIADHEDPASISRAVTSLLTDSARLSKMQISCRHYAETTGSIANEAALIHEVYERLWAGENLRARVP